MGKFTVILILPPSGGFGPRLLRNFFMQFLSETPGRRS
jgi:hypothetical protein